MTASALRFEDVSKIYRSAFRSTEKRALDRFSLEVGRGEVFGFLGPNGAGKTTAIHIALGLMLANRGRGELLDRPFGDHRARRRVGFLPENPAFPHRTAREVLHFNAVLNDVPEAEARKRSGELLEQLGLSDVAERQVNKFSRGMLQRVGLAQALVNDPELLILDEPASALDPGARAQVREALLGCKRQGKTVFLSSHLLSEVESVCDRVAFVVNGRLVRAGSTRELLEDATRFEIVTEDATGLRKSSIVLAGDQRSAIERAWLANETVVGVAPVHRSLEEVFLGLTQPHGGGQ